MKKIFMIFLGCIVVTGAFAEFRFRFFHDFNAYMFNAVIPTGLYAQQSIIGVDGDPQINSGVSQNILARSLLFPVGLGNTTGYFTPTGYNFFTTSVNNDPTVAPANFPNGFSWLDLNDVNLQMIYSARMIEALIGISGSNLFNRMLNRNFPNMNGVLDAFHIEVWWMRVNHHMFTLWIGDRPFPGKVDPYNDFSDWSRLRQDYTGVNVPADRTTDGFSNMWVYRTRQNSLFRDVIDHSHLSRVIERSYFVGSIKLLNHYLQIPIAVDIGIDVSEHLRAINNSATNAGQTRFAGGVRVTGERIANQLNFELIWKLRGGDPSRNNSWSEELPFGSVQPDGTGALSHVLGLALGLPTLIPELGITLMYTALFTSYEDHLFGLHSTPQVTDPYTITKSGPFYSGIDLRLRYTGIPRLRLTLHNNISFAKAAEPVWSDDLNLAIGQSVNLIGNNNLGRYESQSWLALYNALTARYPVGPMMTAILEVAHRTGITTDKNSFETRGSTLNDWGTSVRVMTMMGVQGIASIRLSEGVILESGVSLWYENNSTKFSDYLDGGPGEFVRTSWSGGALGFGLPVRIRFDW